jgi:RNA polymerase sigma-70 factor (ECF subfamily)
LYRIAHNLAVDYFRRHPHHLEEANEFIADERNDPATFAEAVDERRRLRSAIARLTPDQQQVVILKFGQEMTNAEIAAILDKPEGAVKALQHRALTNLRAWLADSERKVPQTKKWYESSRTT